MSIDRARGCFLGLFIGNQFAALSQAYKLYSAEVNLEFEMCNSLAKLLLKHGRYIRGAAKLAYLDCLNQYALTPADPAIDLRPRSALLRMVPLGIYGSQLDLGQVAHLAASDTSLTHPDEISRQVSIIFTIAIAYAIRNKSSPRQTYELMLRWAMKGEFAPDIVDMLNAAASDRPKNAVSQHSRSLLILWNAVHQLLHAPTLEKALNDTVVLRGHLGTNAAVCGALLGCHLGEQRVGQGLGKSAIAYELTTELADSLYLLEGQTELSENRQAKSGF